MGALPCLMNIGDTPDLWEVVILALLFLAFGAIVSKPGPRSISYSDPLCTELK